MKFRLVESDTNMTQEQSEYFKNSKKKNIFYHGSYSDYNEFKKDKIGSGSGGLFGKGFYFAMTPSTAKQYGNIIKAYYLNMVNPYTFYSLSDFELIVNKIREHGYKIDEEELENAMDNEFDFDPMDTLNDIVLDNNFDSYTHNNFSDLVKECGFDSIDAGEEVIVFEPNQIKLVSNLRPTTSNRIDEGYEDIKYTYDIPAKAQEEFDQLYPKFVNGNFGNYIWVTPKGEVIGADNNSHWGLLEDILSHMKNLPDYVVFDDNGCAENDVSIDYVWDWENYVLQKLMWIQLGTDHMDLYISKEFPITKQQLYVLEDFIEYAFNRGYHDIFTVDFYGNVIKYNIVENAKDIIRRFMNNEI